MSDQLSKISLGYSAEEDRLMLRLTMTGGNDIRLAMTRRFVRLLWGALLKVLESNPKVKEQLEPDVKLAILSMQHQEALQSMNIQEERQPPTSGGKGRSKGSGSGRGAGSGEEAADAAADSTEPPEPPEPPAVLVTGFRFGQGGQGAVARLTFQAQDQEVASFSFNEMLLHTLCQMMVTTTMQAEWDLNLTVGDAAAVAMPQDGGKVH